MDSKISLLLNKILVLMALAGACWAAYERGNVLAYIGIAYYVICAGAVLLNHRRTSLLLWLAVLVHVSLTGYMLLDWQINGLIPCYYCVAAAGFALLAAVAWWKTPVVLLPALLMVAVWYAWPMIFYPQTDQNDTGKPKTVKPAIQETTDPAKVSPQENQDNGLMSSNPEQNKDPSNQGQPAQPNKSSTVKNNAIEQKPAVEVPVQQPVNTPPGQGQNSGMSGPVINEPSQQVPAHQEPDVQPEPEPAPVPKPEPEPEPQPEPEPAAKPGST